MMKMKLTSLFRPQPMRLVQTLLVICCTLLPWSATAVNQGKLPSDLFSNKLGRDIIGGDAVGRDIVESLLVKSLMQIAEGNTKQAMDTVNELIRTTPNFKLAYLIRGDLLSAQARTFGANNAALISSTADEVKGLREEARTRIDHYFSADNERLVPDLSVKMDAEQQHLILIDTVKSRLFLYKKSNGGLEHVSDYYVTIGKNGADKSFEGDKRTPVGLYFSRKKLTTPLSDFYGEGAYPLNYPNELDVYNNKTGSGIWLHGTPKDTYSRPPRASDGCVVLSNPDLKELQPVLAAGNVPVIISDAVQWIDNSKASQKTAEIEPLSEALENWRKDWISQNTNSYLSNYSKDFFYSDGKLPEWADHKRRVQAGKPKVTVKISNVSMFSYPTHNHAKAATESGQIVVVNFEQYYESPTLKNKMRKRQYWKNENNQWKIIYEGAA
jgi:murein L,D-transpeptidase YafK